MKEKTIDATPVAEPVDLWVSGIDGYHTYRIPAMIVTLSGTVLAFCEGRRDGGGDAGQIDLLVRRSTDGGATWEPVVTVQDAAGLTNGNPAPVVDRGSGDVVLVFTRNPEDGHETEVWAGRSDRTVWVTRSADDGQTWSEPAEITAQAKDPSWTWYATGPCHAIQTAEGRIVVPCDHGVGEVMDRARDPYRSHVILSDDGGRNWQIGGVLPDGTNESTVAELPDGRLYLNARSHERGHRRGHAWSADGGESFAGFAWQDQLVEPQCQGSVVEGPHGVLFFANPATQSRAELRIRSSGDGGATWSEGVQVTAGPAAYSDLAVVGGREVLCLYETGEHRPYERLRLARYRLADLIASSHNEGDDG